MWYKTHRIRPTNKVLATIALAFRMARESACIRLLSVWAQKLWPAGILHPCSSNRSHARRTALLFPQCLSDAGSCRARVSGSSVRPCSVATRLKTCRSVPNHHRTPLWLWLRGLCRHIVPIEIGRVRYESWISSGDYTRIDGGSHGCIEKMGRSIGEKIRSQVIGLLCRNNCCGEQDRDESKTAQG
jgi:hypothetical protein